ncbi:tyrosine-type recombinase/integrase [Myroides phaeus]|uniref:Integrase/recombinase XerC n=1 Tax=Myroides phaeus TaxID=702745 RepID=A0A1G8BLV1_9FLAO|nr:tyrosine-type recombinase/integrase [Myroides phaeus]MEC4116147.1 tyrosine-type recombinase/integrase [Myroides phaeus]SDH34166.1 integrase/recombinase XerC [Myroides phaeus]
MDKNLERFIEYLYKEKNYSAETIKAYEYDIVTYVDFLASKDLDYLTVKYDGVRLWIVELSEQGVSNRSINRKMSSLRSYYKFLQKIEEVDVSPLQLHRSLKVEKKLQLPFSVNEIDAVRERLDGLEDFNSIRDLLIVEMLYCLGLRRAELVALKISDVDFYQHQVKVLGKGDKVRVIPVVQVVEKILKKYISVRGLVMSNMDKNDNLLVNEKGNKINEMFVYRVINRYFSNVTTKEKKSPHVLRHSFATHLLENGADINSIKELMGHESLGTTQGYAQINLKELKKVYQGAHPRMKKK